MEDHKYSTTHVIGLSYEGPLPPELDKLCWMYVSDADIPFYRVSILSNYSPLVVKDASK